MRGWRKIDTRSLPTRITFYLVWAALLFGWFFAAYTVIDHFFDSASSGSHNLISAAVLATLLTVFNIVRIERRRCRARSAK